MITGPAVSPSPRDAGHPADEAEIVARMRAIITPECRLSVPKVRAFVDFATPRLKAEFTRLNARFMPQLEHSSAAAI